MNETNAQRVGGIQIGDFWGGLTSMLVSLPSAIAFGVLVFSAIDPSLAGQGALYGMLGAAALGLVAPLAGGTAGLITAPCAPSAAVLSGLAATLVASGTQSSQIPGLLALTAVLSAMLQILYGLIRGGRFIKFIPYPVVSGYLSGVGLIIALGQLPKLLSLPAGTTLVHGVLSTALWDWFGVTVGVVTILVMVFAPKVTTKVPAAILALLAGVLTYFGLGLFRPELIALHGNPLIIGPLEMQGSLVDSVTNQFAALLELTLNDLQPVIYPALTLSALLSIDTLKTCVVLDALTLRRHNSNRELFGQGIANLAAFATGGMPGAGTMGPTLVNVNSGGKTARSGLLEGAFVVLALLALSQLIAWVPLASLAGILLVIAFRMFDWGAFRLLRSRNTQLDFAVIASVVIVAETVGLIAASATGVALAILLFVRDQIRGSVLRRSASLKQISSKTRRLDEARKRLIENGELGGVYDLDGDLFFGTTDQLLTLIEPDLKVRRWLLMDLRRVHTMDYTAANLFRQLNNRLAVQGGALLICGMPSGLLFNQDIEGYLIDVGLLGETSSVQIFETRDEGIEWMEDRILELSDWRARDPGRPLDLGEIDLFADADAEAIEGLRSYMKEIGAAKGETVVVSEAKGDEIYLIRKGSVRILLPLPGGKAHHVATYGRGDFFGEMAFLDLRGRSANADAREDCQLFVLSRGEFDQFAQTNPESAFRIITRLSRALATRLRHANIELRALQER